VAKLSNRS